MGGRDVYEELRNDPKDECLDDRQSRNFSLEQSKQKLKDDEPLVTVYPLFQTDLLITYLSEFLSQGFPSSPRPRSTVFPI